MTPQDDYVYRSKPLPNPSTIGEQRYNPTQIAVNPVDSYNGVGSPFTNSLGPDTPASGGSSGGGGGGGGTSANHPWKVVLSSPTEITVSDVDSYLYNGAADLTGLSVDGTNTPISASVGDWVMIHIVFDTSNDMLAPITQELVVGDYDDRVVSTGGSPDRQSDLYIPLAYVQSGPAIQQKVWSDLVLLSDCLNFVAVKLAFQMT